MNDPFILLNIVLQSKSRRLHQIFLQHTPYGRWTREENVKKWLYDAFVYKTKVSVGLDPNEFHYYSIYEIWEDNSKEKQSIDYYFFPEQTMCVYKDTRLKLKVKLTFIFNENDDYFSLCILLDDENIIFHYAVGMYLFGCKKYAVFCLDKMIEASYNICPPEPCLHYVRQIFNIKKEKQNNAVEPSS